MHFSFTFRWGRRFSPAVALWLLASAAGAEIVDRVEIAIGQHAITASQIDEEIRVTDLLNHAPVLIDLAARRRAAGQLIEQYFVTRETEVSHFPAPADAEVKAYFEKVEEEYGGPEQLPGALEKYGLTRAVLEQHLALQLRTLAFTRFRFPTDEALNRWLREARRRSSILYLDKDLQ
ncbi:MAG TPA: hypothetical protein VKX25_09000 [Bryobacteraceae bacterium]|jgi:hypothetical protein|nr:hypothetical protein [Bryobacteraceae bacterium]